MGEFQNAGAIFSNAGQFPLPTFTGIAQRNS